MKSRDLTMSRLIHIMSKHVLNHSNLHLFPFIFFNNCKVKHEILFHFLPFLKLHFINFLGIVLMRRFFDLVFIGRTILKFQFHDQVILIYHIQAAICLNQIFLNLLKSAFIKFHHQI